MRRSWHTGSVARWGKEEISSAGNYNNADTGTSGKAPDLCL